MVRSPIDEPPGRTGADEPKIVAEAATGFAGFGVTTPRWGGATEERFDSGGCMSRAVQAGETHRLVPSPAGRIHLVERGTGPLVLLVHGFPESWHSWRHQLAALAAAGYRAVAVDVRGYGRSSKPDGVAAYRMPEPIEDDVAVVRALGEETAIIVGHDRGSGTAANSALVRPEVFTAVGLLSVPYAPRGGPRPSEVFARMGGEEEFYVGYFQKPGRAEAEIEPDVRGWPAGFYAALSGDTTPAPGMPDPLTGRLASLS